MKDLQRSLFSQVLKNDSDGMETNEVSITFFFSFLLSCAFCNVGVAFQNASLKREWLTVFIHVHSLH